MDLQKLSREWTSKGFEDILEDQLKKIEQAYNLQQSFQKQRENQNKGGKNIMGGIKANLKVKTQITKAQQKRKGWKSASQHIAELGLTLISASKVKALTLTPNILSWIVQHGTLGDLIALQNKGFLNQK